MTTPQQIRQLLGYAGLIPFVVPALLVVSASEYAGLALQVGNIYAFGIVSFLTGSWWGMALSSGSGKALLFSNGYFLTAFFIFVVAREWWPLAAAILLISLFFTEQNSSSFTVFPSHYRRLRTILTSLASASMLTLHLAQ